MASIRLRSTCKPIKHAFMPSSLVTTQRNRMPLPSANSDAGNVAAGSSMARTLHSSRAAQAASSACWA